ncbi:MAG: hypothetical protein IPL29_10360 [Propionivibrio sp.]|nr:hypothetical protein [Propionivibrio sp.]
MDYQLTENQTWVQTLIFIVYQPMVANKVGRYPLSQIISQFPANERTKVKLGIDGLIELSIFVMDGRDICITNKSEALLQGLSHIVGKPADAVEDMLKTSPAFSATLAAINSDSRFAPPPEPPRDTTRSNSAPPQHTPTSGGKPTGLGDKIVLGIFLVIVLLGLMKLIFRY